MADNADQKTEDQQDDTGAPVKKRGIAGLGLRLVLIIALSSLSLAGGLVAAIGLDGVGNLISGSSETDDEESDAEEQEEAGEEEVYGIMNFEEFIVNITGYSLQGRKTTRYMKVKLSIVYDEAEFSSLEDRKLFIRDSFQDYMRQLDERELEGSYGIISLKAELLKRAKAIAGTKGPREILIGDLIIQ